MPVRKGNVSTRVAVIENDLRYIKDGINDIKEKLESHYITKEEFDPVKKIVYGLIGLILLAVVTSLMALVLM